MPSTDGGISERDLFRGRTAQGPCTSGRLAPTRNLFSPSQLHRRRLSFHLQSTPPPLIHPISSHPIFASRLRRHGRRQSSKEVLYGHACELSSPLFLSFEVAPVRAPARSSRPSLSSLRHASLVISSLNGFSHRNWSSWTFCRLPGHLTPFCLSRAHQLTAIFRASWSTF